MGVLLLLFVCWVQFWDYGYLVCTLNILLLNVTGLNSAVERTCVLEYLHRKSISGALTCNTVSSGIFLHVFCECPVVMDLWTHVDLVLSSSLRTDCLVDTCVFLKLNAKEKAVCWFCGCEEDDDAELVWATRVWRVEADIFSGIPRVTGIPRESRGMGNKIATNHVIGTGREKN